MVVFVRVAVGVLHRPHVTTESQNVLSPRGCGRVPPHGDVQTRAEILISEKGEGGSKFPDGTSLL